MKGSFLLPDNIQPYMLWYSEENGSIERGVTQGQAEVQGPEVSHTMGLRPLKLYLVVEQVWKLKWNLIGEFSTNLKQT